MAGGAPPAPGVPAHPRWIPIKHPLRLKIARNIGGVDGFLGRPWGKIDHDVNYVKIDPKFFRLRRKINTVFPLEITF